MSKDNLKALGSNGTNYTDKYDPSQLEGFPRAPRREDKIAPMNGTDIWTAFEVSFLLTSGLPCFMVLRISNPADSENIFESKSLKLYLNSFNNTTFTSKGEVIEVIKKDLSDLVKGVVEVEQMKRFEDEDEFYLYQSIESHLSMNFRTQDYGYNKDLLETVPTNSLRMVEVFTDLLRSNCEITNQPDWGRVYIKYLPGKKLVTNESLLKYVVSLRTHQAFHEPTCELIYDDLFRLLEPKELLVICQYTRRGGIDINPCRYTSEELLRGYNLLDLPKLIQQ